VDTRPSTVVVPLSDTLFTRPPLTEGETMRLQKSQKITTALVFAAACLLPLAGVASATDLGIQMGYYFDSNAIGIGFGALTSISDTQQWFFNPNAEMIAGDRDMAAFNLDFHYDFAQSDELTFWAGAGPALYVIDQPFDDDMDPALNLLAGFGSMTGNVRPFVQGKAVIMDNSEASIAVGLRF